MSRPKLSAKEYFKQLFTMFAIFFKIGLFSFGGGYAMLTLIESEVVEKKQWLTHSELADIFAIAESTPGPIAINTATFIGTKQLGIFGGIIASLGVIIPSFVIIVALSYIIDIVKDNVWVGYIFKGIKVAVLVLISKAVITFYKDMRKNVFSFVLMIAGFSLVFFTNISVIYIILATIVVCSIAVAIRHIVNKKLYFSLNTPEYYSEKYGRPLQKDEYVRETIDKQAVSAQKTSCYENSTENSQVETSLQNADNTLELDKATDNDNPTEDGDLGDVEGGGEL